MCPSECAPPGSKRLSAASATKGATEQNTETVYRGEIRPFGKTPGRLTTVHLPPGLAQDLRLWKHENAKTFPAGAVSPDAFIFPNSRGGFMCTGNYGNRV